MRIPFRYYIKVCVFRPLPLLCLLFFSFGAWADNWHALKEVDGIALFYREVPGSGVIALKGTGTIDAPVWKVASIFLDMQRAPEWIDKLIETHLLRMTGPSSFVAYAHLGTPFMVKDRDFVTLTRIELKPEEKALNISYQPTEDSSAPKTSYVRGEILEGAFSLTAVQKTSLLKAQIHVDPKGRLPKWIVNFFQKDWALKTFRSVRKQASKEDISIPVQFREIIEQAQKF